MKTLSLMLLAIALFTGCLCDNEENNDGPGSNPGQAQDDDNNDSSPNNDDDNTENTIADLGTLDLSIYGKCLFDENGDNIYEGDKVLYYDGMSWKIVYEEYDIFITGIWGSNKDDVWICG